MNLSKPLRDRLFRKAEERFSGLTGTFHKDYLTGSLQRNMQALGAYGFLSLKKGKMKYLAYAEPCLKLLLEGVEELLTLNDPVLHPYRLAEVCRNAGTILPEKLAILKGN